MAGQAEIIGLSWSLICQAERQMAQSFLDNAGIRQVRSPLTAAMLSPIPSHVDHVQFDEALAEKDYPKLAALLARHPKVALRVYGDYSQTFRDLEFLPGTSTRTHWSWSRPDRGIRDHLGDVAAPRTLRDNVSRPFENSPSKTIPVTSVTSRAL